MKKTISISVSNMLFHVEENACEVLQNYLNTLKFHFEKEEGGEEIYNDIQARAAEILHTKTSITKQVITSEDVNDLISKLGTPADFGMEENTNTKNTQQQYQQQQYFNTNNTKRLYRDPDNKIVGGVCSGIGYYFGFDPLWLRIALFASLIFYGFGFIPYLIMLLVVPKAETTAEKLEMRGEPVNVDTISKMMQDELKGVGTRVGKMGAEVNQNLRRNSGNFFSRFFELLGEIIMGIFSILGKIITVLLIILACILFFSLIPLIATYFSGSNSEFAYFVNGVFPDTTTAHIAIWSLVAICLGPIIALLYHGIRSLLGQKEKNKVVSYITGLLFIFGLAGLVYSQIKLKDQFDYKAEKPETEKLSIESDTLKIKLIDNSIQSKDKKVARVYRKRWLWNPSFKLDNLQYFDNDSIEFFGGRIDLDISLADSNYYELEINKSSNGATKEHAKTSAERIQYQFQTTDNELLLNKIFILLKDEKWRNQDVELDLKVPENKIIYLDRNLNRVLDNVKNDQDLDDYQLSGKYHKMTKLGLTCIDCTAKKEINIEGTNTNIVEKDTNDVSINLNASKEGVNINISDKNSKHTDVTDVKSQRALDRKRELMEVRKRKTN